MDDTECDRESIDSSAKDGGSRGTGALEVEATSRRFPRRFSLPRVVTIACERSLPPDVSGGTGFLRSFGGNVVIKT